MTLDDARTLHLIDHARALGFPAAGIAAVEPMDPAPLRAWLAAGYGASMEYLHRHLSLRADLTRVLSGARSVICVALPYDGPAAGESPMGAVACYARGRDYHEVMREKLEQLWAAVRTPEAKGRIFVDGGPLPERELARRAGLGWVGKQSCVIHPELGSRFVLGEILTTLELAPTTPIAPRCGDCRRCLDVCPTGALVSPGVVDARRCLSYLTIEHRGAIPSALRPHMGTRLFGCDACQDACPYNRQAGVTYTPPTLDELPALTPEEFTRRFRGTALARAKRAGLLRNACVALGNLADPAHLPALTIALRDSEPLVRGHAAWALGRLGQRNLLVRTLAAEPDAVVREEIAAALLPAHAVVTSPVPVVALPRREPPT